LSPPAVEFHPNAANAYRDKVRDLKKALAETDEDSRAAAHEAIREIVEKVVIHPQGPYKPVEIEIHGQLAALLRISERAAADPLESRGVLVAGIGFEPMTFQGHEAEEPIENPNRSGIDRRAIRDPSVTRTK
jgi:site-specific DNA recombinase